MATDEERRARMVREQLEARGVKDVRVLDAMRSVPRHLFVPPHLAAEAYDDRALPIAGGQTISQPYIVALMTEALAVESSHSVLEVGTGSGYQAAVLCRLARHVTTIERHAALADAAREQLRLADCGSVDVVVGDGTAGYAPAAPFDRIVVTAGAPQIPDALKEQLVDGGRLVIPVGSAFHQELFVIRRVGEQFEEEPRAGCVFVPLVGEFGWPERRT